MYCFIVAWPPKETITDELNIEYLWTKQFFIIKMSICLSVSYFMRKRDFSFLLFILNVCFFMKFSHLVKILLSLFVSWKFYIYKSKYPYKCLGYLSVKVSWFSFPIFASFLSLYFYKGFVIFFSILLLNLSLFCRSLKQIKF